MNEKSLAKKGIWSLESKFFQEKGHKYFPVIVISLGCVYICLGSIDTVLINT